VQLQQVEEGRANVLATRSGTGGGKTLMFNGHLDTSYSGREPWSQGVEGFQPAGVERDGRIWGLGISNMKGALACYLAALDALRDEELAGDVIVAAVSGEIEKTQYGDAQGSSYRGYAAGTRHLVTHGGVADMCLLGEPTEGKVVLGHFGSLWARIGVGGDFVHTAFSEGRANSVLRMGELLEPVRAWCERWSADERNAYRGVPAIASVGAIRGGFEWRLSRTPQRTSVFLDVRVPPTRPMADARRAVLDLARGLEAAHPDWEIDSEVYVTAPGAEIDEGHELVGAIHTAHEAVFGEAPGRDVPRWFSDASALTAYGIPTVNYGTSTGLMEPGKGESLEIDGLVKTADVYARVARTVCG
jgi:acetylornithine deacetylase/succinyl-diaminopimelate desuccinylase-like protein